MGTVDSLRCRDNKRHEIILSVDLGKTRDYTALAVCEARPKEITSFGGKDGRVMELEVLNLRRLPLGTDYAEVAKAIHDLYHDERLWLREKHNHAPVSPSCSSTPVVLATPCATTSRSTWACGLSAISWCGVRLELPSTSPTTGRCPGPTCSPCSTVLLAPTE